jgi:hypothetical protein
MLLFFFKALVIAIAPLSSISLPFNIGERHAGKKTYCKGLNW